MARTQLSETFGSSRVRLRFGVAVHREGQGPVVVGQLDAQRRHGVQVADLVRAGEEVPGHVPGPGGSIDEIGGAAERGDLRELPVDGGLQRDLQGVQVPAGGVGPRILQRQDGGVGGVQPGVLQGLACVVGGLGVTYPSSAVATSPLV